MTGVQTCALPICDSSCDVVQLSDLDSEFSVSYYVPTLLLGLWADALHGSTRLTYALQVMSPL